MGILILSWLNISQYIKTKDLGRSQSLSGMLLSLIQEWWISETGTGCIERQRPGECSWEFAQIYFDVRICYWMMTSNIFSFKLHAKLVHCILTNSIWFSNEFDKILRWNQQDVCSSVEPGSNYLDRIFNQGGEFHN